MTDLKYCDACGISVKALWVTVKKELTLKFCGHHKNRFEEKLIEEEWIVVPLFLD